MKEKVISFLTLYDKYKVHQLVCFYIFTGENILLECSDCINSKYMKYERPDSNYQHISTIGQFYIHVH